jgi:hypothetical protein
MRNHLCPECFQPVPPVAVWGARVRNGITGSRPEGLLIERRPCPTCGVQLERLLLGDWCRVGALVLDDSQLVMLG